MIRDAETLGGVLAVALFFGAIISTAGLNGVLQVVGAVVVVVFFVAVRACWRATG